jgi:hypothetical protein
MRLIGGIAIALFLAGAAVGLLKTRAAPRATTTATLSQASSPSVQPADPTMDAQCVQEPNGIAPRCTQGNYAVSVPIGASCSGRYQAPEAWQWTYSGSTTARCMTVEP